MAIEGACHCGAVRFRYAGKPEWLTRCNCSYCRRTGALWAHGPASAITVTAPPDGLIRYVQGDATLAFVRCARCGCLTHWESLSGEEDPRMAVNCAMAAPDAIASMRVRHFDGAESWDYLD